MTTLSEIYRPPLALLTDLYQLTMAYGYWKQGLAEREAIFHLTFRQHPFSGQFAVACGLNNVVDLLRGFQFSAEDGNYLKSVCGADERPLFDPAFVEQLQRLRFRCDVDAVPEGTVVFAHEPLVRVRGPLLQAQLLETALLNLVNFPTLIATKAARITLAAQGDSVIEFGLRRAQGIDGGLTASRAAYIGGCAGTSNVLAGKLYDIPVRGTHAHSWVMVFDSELEAFQTYAQALPNNCVFLVDTYDTLQGVRNAVAVGARLREQGHRLLGVRLDSGDLARLSTAGREILDAGGFPDAVIVASNDLDEHDITALKRQGAAINTWGIGTKLATAYDQPALGGVYKLSAIHGPRGWQCKIKLSEQSIKVSTPGQLQVRRFRDAGGMFLGDVIVNELAAIEGPLTSVSWDGTSRWLPPDSDGEELLVPVMRRGESVYASPTTHFARQYCQQQLASLEDRVKRLEKPEPYTVGLEHGLFELKQQLMEGARGTSL